MRLTRTRDLVAIAAVTLLLAWMLLRLLDRSRGILPAMPWSVPAVLLLLAGSVVISAVVLRRRLRGDVGVKPPDPLAAARMVALAKSTSHAGAVLVGIYAGIALFFLSGDVSDLRRTRAYASLAATAACIALVGAGIFLERVCRVDPPADEKPPQRV